MRAFAGLLVMGVIVGTTSARADETAKKQVEAEKPNEAVRAKEGATTALPSVAGRPVRRYAEKNVVEAGGSFLFVHSNAFTQLGASPTFGWFFVDYVELSVIPQVDYVKTSTSSPKARFSMLLEPSFHIPMTGPLFLFFGAGMGGAYEEASGFGLAITPRTGFNVLIGGSGVLNLAVSYAYTATKRTAVEDGSTDPHTSTIGLQAGYSVAW